MTRLTEKDYPLTVEIIVDHPCGASLRKGDQHMARLDCDGDYHVLDTHEPEEPWRIMEFEAKVVK